MTTSSTRACAVHCRLWWWRSSVSESVWSTVKWIDSSSCRLDVLLCTAGCDAEEVPRRKLQISGGSSSQGSTERSRGGTSPATSWRWILERRRQECIEETTAQGTAYVTRPEDLYQSVRQSVIHIYLPICKSYTWVVVRKASKAYLLLGLPVYNRIRVLILVLKHNNLHKTYITWTHS